MPLRRRTLAHCLAHCLALPAAALVARAVDAAGAAGAADKPAPASAAGAAARRAYSFGIVPQQSATELARMWIPLLVAASQRCGLTLRFATAPDIPSFERRLAAGAYDFAYMNPYHYTVFSQRSGYAAFAKEEGRKLKGIVVVRKDSRVTTLEQLAQAELAFPAPAAFAATVLVRAELERRKIAYRPRFVNSHESVYLNVARGLYPAGGGIARTLQTMPAEARDELRVLWTTAEYTPHAFAALPRVAAGDVRAVTEALRGLPEQAAGQAALEGLGFKGIEAARDADWNDIRALGLDKLAALLHD